MAFVITPNKSVLVGVFGIEIDDIASEIKVLRHTGLVCGTGGVVIEHRLELTHVKPGPASVQCAKQLAEPVEAVFHMCDFNRMHADCTGWLEIDTKVIKKNSLTWMRPQMLQQQLINFRLGFAQSNFP